MALAADLSSEWLLVFEPPPHVTRLLLRTRKAIDALSPQLLTGRCCRKGGAVLSSLIPSGLKDPSSADGARNLLALQRDIQEFWHAIGAPEWCAFPVIVAARGLVLGSASISPPRALHIGLTAVPKIVGNHSVLRELVYSAALAAARMGLLSRAVPGGRKEVVRVALMFYSLALC
ncbi:hypothetical protein B0H19DRAFT_1256376 [Mycena capillaripes]|nr:hypothetical protein B0H19DRAFT_1256376 [Mycena capillaripes]